MAIFLMYIAQCYSLLSWPGQKPTRMSATRAEHSPAGRYPSTELERSATQHSQQICSETRPGGPALCRMAQNLKSLLLDDDVLNRVGNHLYN